MWAWLLDRLRRRRHASLGELGEDAAARYLRRKGLRIIARRQRDKFGELDIVAVDRRVVVFVEVKTRRTGNPAEAVDHIKQRRITRAALAYLKRHHLLESAVRFDIVAVTWPVHVRRPTIQHFVHAFEPVGFGQFFG